MNCNKITVGVIMWLLCGLLLTATVQKADAQYSQSERKSLKTANNYFEAGRYAEALQLYVQLDSVIDDINLRYRIGLCYLNSIGKQYKAISYLEEVSVSAGSLVSIDAIRYLGDAYHKEYRFEDAIKEYNRFIDQTAKSNNADINKLNYCKRMISICRNAIVITGQPYKVEVEPVNSLFSTESDYNPLISADESIMLMMQEQGLGKGINTAKRIMISVCDDNGVWQNAEPVTVELDHKLQQQEVKLAGLSPDGNTVFLNIGIGISQDIYSGTLNGKVISNVKKLNKNINTPYYEGAASITPDGTKLYFVSDRPGGYGGHDIYVSSLNKKGEWDEPVNLGDEINTKYDEESPHIHYDGKTLFFSSEGHNTIGGRDIFRTQMVNGDWSQPENMGFPNTTDDDISFVLNASGENGYFSTSKNNPYEIDDECYRWYQQAEQAMNDFQSDACEKAIAKLQETARAKKDEKARTLYYVEELKPLSGLDQGVYDYVLKQPDAEEYMRLLTAFLDFQLPRFQEEGKASLTVAVGCTGGRHRSVAVARTLTDYLLEHGQIARLICRDMDRTADSQ